MCTSNDGYYLHLKTWRTFLDPPLRTRRNVDGWQVFLELSMLEFFWRTVINLNSADSIFHSCEIFHSDGCWDNYPSIDERKSLKKKKPRKLSICIIKHTFVKYKWVLEDWCEVFLCFIIILYETEKSIYFLILFFFGLKIVKCKNNYIQKVKADLVVNNLLALNTSFES